MPKVVAIRTASPAHRLSQARANDFVKQAFAAAPEAKHLSTVFEHAQVRERQIVEDIDWFLQKHSFTETNQRYVDAALDWSEHAVTSLARHCDLHTRDFDAIFFVSTTGLATPSLDARLANRIEMNRHLRRIPIWGLGCAAGVSAIARAHDYLLAHPRHRALILSVEICSLAFHLDDLSKGGLISTALFGDGAAACLLVGDEVVLPQPGRSPSTKVGRSTLYPETLDLMGWEIGAEGFRVKLSRDIPSVVRTLVKDDLLDFLESEHLSLKQIEHFIFHPGGTRVLAAYSESLGIPAEKFRHSIDVLAEHGNMSSVTVFFILKRFLEMKPPPAESYGLLSALGPGFSSEWMVIQWS